MKDDWIGETTCQNYHGVKEKKERKCCGNKRSTLVAIDCSVHRVCYGHNCRKQFCEFYVNKTKEGLKK